MSITTFPRQVTSIGSGLSLGTGGALSTTVQISRVTGQVDNITNTLAAITGLSATLEAATKYVGWIEILCQNSTAGEGLQFDLNGGAATMTSIRGQGILFDTALLKSQQITALTTATSAATVTGTASLRIDFGLVCANAGTFIPRFAEVSAHVAGTASVFANSFMHVEKSLV